MRQSNRSRLPAVLITAIVSGMLVLGQPRQAYAYGEVLLLMAPIIVTYLTVMPIVCTPVAAVKASDYPGGFSGAFKDCFALKLNDQQTSSTVNNPADKPAEAESDEIKDRFKD
jgi:hypothetical protein